MGKLLLWPWVVSVLVLVVGGCGHARYRATHDQSPQAKGGQLELSRWQPETQGAVHLHGEWDFYWDRLLTPADFEQSPSPRPTAQLRLPTAWDLAKGSDGKWQRSGVATFRLRLLGAPVGRELALWIPEQQTAYRLWLGGQLVASNGAVGRGQREPAPSPADQLVRVVVSRSDVDLILQVANYHAAHGGPTGTLALGTEAELRSLQLKFKLLDAVLFGCLLVMGVYHAGLFWFRRQERVTAYISIACLAFAMRILFFGFSGRLVVELIPQLPWEAAARLQAAFGLWGIAAAALYVDSCLQPTRIGMVSRWLAYLAAPMGLVALATPRWVIALALYPMFALTAAVCVALFVPILQAVGSHVPHARRLLVSWSLLASVGLFEIAGYWTGSTGVQIPIMPFGVFLFMLVQSLSTAARFHSTFAAIESLSGELQRTNAELLRIEALKERLLANTSHELRTPLHGIVGLTESLLEGAAGPLSQKGREILGLVVSSGRRLGALVGDILDLSRLQRDDIRLDRRPVDPRTVVRAALALLAPAAKQKGLLLVNEVPTSIPNVFADENRFHQIIINLVDNAIKYTERGEIRVSARACNQDVALMVSDTGRGIRPDKLKSVFDVYERAASASPQSGGLGLTITRGLAQLHGGRVDVQSSLATGTVFIVHLPAVTPGPESSVVDTGGHAEERRSSSNPAGCTCPTRAARMLQKRPATVGTLAEASPAPQETTPPPPMEMSATPTEGALRVGSEAPPAEVQDQQPTTATVDGDAALKLPQGSEPPLIPSAVGFGEWEPETLVLRNPGAQLAGARVLVVDDDPIGLRVVTQQLEGVEAEVVAVPGADEAMALLSDGREPFDLALVDVMMPKVTGYELTEETRRRHKAEEFPILLLTARAQPADVALGFAMGANDYLVKPFSGLELIARCKLHVELKRAFEAAKARLRLECELQQRQAELASANLRAANAELDMLRYQVNPHLLFNTLASIRGAIRVEPDTARQMVTMLSEYYRLTLVNQGKVPLPEELRMTKLYLQIHESRQRLSQSAQWDIQSGTDRLMVPSLLLQPIVENAVMCGRAGAEGRIPSLRIAASVDSGTLKLRVSNEGRWQESGKGGKKGQGIGLNNVRQRLEHHYGGDAQMNVRESEGWVHVELLLPAQTAEATPANGASSSTGNSAGVTGDVTSGTPAAPDGDASPKYCVDPG